MQQPASVTTHETLELCARLTAEVGLVEHSTREEAILDQIRIDLGCTATDATLYRSTVPLLGPGWKLAALPLTKFNDDLTPPFPLPKPAVAMAYRRI